MVIRCQPDLTLLGGQEHPARAIRMHGHSIVGAHGDFPQACSFLLQGTANSAGAATVDGRP
jgi:hypothetical protein